MKPKYILIAVLTIAVVCILAALALYHYIPNPTERGQFGDMFGVVNTFFSGIAFFGLIYTIYLQQQDSQRARYEFSYNRTIQSINTQVSFFNEAINEYKFNIEASPSKIIRFNELTDFYRLNKDNDELMTSFYKNNGSEIIGLTSFIADTLGFVENLITRERLTEQDSLALQVLFSRNINQYTINFVTIAISYNEKNKIEPEFINDEKIKKHHKQIRKISAEKLQSIVHFLKYNFE